MSGFPDLIKDVLAGIGRQEQFQQPDRIPPVGDRHDHPLPLAGRLLVEPLGTDHLLVDTELFPT